MGRVRTRLVKRTSTELLRKFYNEFSTDFEENKRKVQKLISVRSKRLRNQIAGYITHLKKIEEKRKKMVMEKLGSEVQEIESDVEEVK